MSDDPKDPDAPVWGAKGWPRELEGGLDEGDHLLIRRMLALTPLERLEAVTSSANALEKLRRARVRAD